MLNKLLKYDLKYMLKNMLIFYILTIFFSITTRILLSFNETIMISIIGKISIGCLIAMFFNVIINSIIRSWVRFKDSIYKDESYLTHTLPVEKKDIYESKFLQTFIFLIIGLLVILLGIFIAFYTKDNWLLLTSLIDKLSINFNIPIVLFLVLCIIMFFLEMFNLVQSGFLGIILGYNKNNFKVALSMVYGFITYIITQVVVLILIFIPGLFNNEFMALFTKNELPSSNIILVLAIVSIIVYILITFVMNIICVKTLNKGVNIE